MFQVPPAGVRQQVILNCGLGCIKKIRERRLKDNGQTKGKIESHSGKKNPLLIKGALVPQHCGKTTNHDLLRCFRSIIKLANILLFKNTLLFKTLLKDVSSFFYSSNQFM